MTVAPVSRRLLVCSLGNPGPQYALTRHSAGHILLRLSSSSLGSPPLQKDSRYKGPITRTPCGTYTFFASPSYMNVSGPALKHAWKTFLGEMQGIDKENALMVVLHDDMEKPPGQCRFRRTGSAQGHNGLKSVMESFGSKDILRIGIGIGRPKEREPVAVADYVLRQPMPREMQELETTAVEKVISHLKHIQQGL
ncbi:peptidyl-tRNA hydrolase [Pyronema omphalodes]|nr:peptidyl-tRNA hydrolase [Pyronema omphalodes]